MAFLLSNACIGLIDYLLLIGRTNVTWDQAILWNCVWEYAVDWWIITHLSTFYHIQVDTNYYLNF